MTNVWKPTPQFKIEVGSTTYTNDDAFSIEITRPENNISSCVMTLNDYKNKNYVGVFDTFTSFYMWLRYGTDTWIKVFSGKVFQLRPTISDAGEFLTISAWGNEFGLLKTFADTSWGTESRRNHTKDTIQAIYYDLIDNYVNLSFGGAATNWGMTYDALDGPLAGCTVSYLNSNYLDNFSIMNRLCDIGSAYAQGLGQAGIHWYVDTLNSLRLKQISASTADNEWTRYWNNALTTLTVNEDMILYDFQKTMDGYTNDVVFATAFRLPAEDYWTEGHGASWGHDANIDHADDADPCIVGTTSLQWTTDGVGAVSNIWYPGVKGAAWDFTKVGNALHPPLLSYYAREEAGSTFDPAIRLYEESATPKYFSLYASQPLGSDDHWEHFTFPLGEYHEIHIDDYKQRWVNTNGAVWSNINWIQFLFAGNVSKSFWLDDLHFSGNIVRRAYDSHAWATYNDQQKIILNDTAVNDVLKSNVDTGTAARLAYAELKRGMAAPIVGVVQVPMIVNILPGHQLHIHACKKADGTYRIDKDAGGNDDVWRVTELKHVINRSGFYTQLNLTNDDMNSHAMGAPTIAGLLQEYMGALGHKEAKDLKGGVLDNLIDPLEINY